MHAVDLLLIERPGLAQPAAAVVAAALTAAFLVSPLALGMAGGAARTSCASGRSTTIVNNRQARVFMKRTSGRFYLCSYRSGRRRLLGPKRQRDLDNERLGVFRLTGDDLAYERTFTTYSGSTSPSSPSYSILVRDVRTGKLLRQVNAAPADASPQGPAAGDGVTDLVVSRRGAIAWIVQNPNTTASRSQVRKSDAGGDALLDSGDAIGRGSLTLRHGTASWRNGSATRIYVLR